ncbi:MAG: hypothetical protein RSA20_00950 [Oscillospiraceae bacterium]
MRLFFKELYKLWTKKVFVLYLCVLVFANIFLMWTYSQPTAYSPPSSAYAKLTHELRHTGIEEQYRIVSDRFKEISAISKIDYAVKTAAYDKKAAAQMMNNEYAEEFKNYKSVYESKDYLHYTGNISAEYRFLEEMNREVSEAAGYEDFLVNIGEKAKKLSSISIFAKEGGYDQNNIKATAKAYENMSGVPINYSPQKGLVTAISFDLTDIVLIFIMVLISFIIVREERENGLLSLIRSTSGGRFKTAMAKFMAMGVSLLAAVILLYGTNLIYCNFTYGLGDLTRSIQSVPYLMRSTLKVNVWQYLVLFLLTKWGAAIICGGWILLCMLVAKRTFYGILGALSMPLLHWIIRSTIPATNKLNVIKYANLASLLETNEILGSYRNLYWLNNQPIQLNLVETVAAISFLLVFLSLFIWAFCKLGLLNTPKKPLVVFSRFKRKTQKPTTIAKQEWYKLLVMNGGVVLLAVAIAFQGYQAYTAENYITADEMFYSYYMKNLSGSYTVEKRDFLQEENKKFEPLQKAQQMYSNGMITGEEYQMIMASNYILQQEYNVFAKVLGKLQYLKQKPNADLVYETGYIKLFGLNDLNMNLKDALFATFSLVVLLSGLFSMEKSSGMKKVIFATPLGRKDTVVAKLKVSAVVSSVIAVLSILPRMWQVGRGYGFKGLFSPAMSIQEYTRLSPLVLIVFLMVLLILARVLACFAIGSIVLMVSQISPSFILAVMVSALVTAFPLVLYYMDVGALQYFSFYPLFNITALLTGTQTTFIAFAYSVLSAAIVCFCVDYLLLSYNEI